MSQFNVCRVCVALVNFLGNYFNNCHYKYKNILWFQLHISHDLRESLWAFPTICRIFTNQLNGDKRNKKFLSRQCYTVSSCILHSRLTASTAACPAAAGDWVKMLVPVPQGEHSLTCSILHLHGRTPLYLRSA